MILQEPLAPLMLPPEPSFFWPPPPLAWWAGISILSGFITWLGYRFWVKPRRLPSSSEAAIANKPETQPSEDPWASLRQTALEELAQLSKPESGGSASQWLQQINALLKRISRTRYPNTNPHTLSGRAWLAFLDGRCPAAGLTRWMILVEGAYRAECTLDAHAVQGLEQAVSIWIQKHA